MRKNSREDGREAAPDAGFVDPREEIVEDFLGGAPRAEQWRAYKDVLLARYREAVEARDTADPDSPDFASLEKRVRELREQVQALAEEEAVTQFVEDSVRASLTRPRPFVAPDEDDEYGDGGY